MTKILVDLPEEIDRKLSILKASNKDKNKAVTIIKLLEIVLKK